MVCHHLSRAVPEDIAFAESRIREETIGAEDWYIRGANQVRLHDIGAISIISSDSQAMGRVGEVISRTWQTADKMKQIRGALPEDDDESDNLRVKRYIGIPPLPNQKRNTRSTQRSHTGSPISSAPSQSANSPISSSFPPSFSGQSPRASLRAGSLLGQ
jgi:hypothetical protein